MPGNISLDYGLSNSEQIHCVTLKKKIKAYGQATIVSSLHLTCLEAVHFTFIAFYTLVLEIFMLGNLELHFKWIFLYGTKFRVCF